MATVILGAAGAAIGSSIGGSVLGVAASTIGQTVGALAGSVIDQTLLGSGSVAVETGRARSLRLQSSTEGAAVPRCFGRVRIAGQVIWATRYLENVRTTTQGGKSSGQGQRQVTEFSYSISIAVGLCEGPIERIGRVWADGKLLNLNNLNHRIYLGDDEQLPDPKIEAVEGAGNVPAYRGLAYVVFENLPVGRFGNRIPQLNFEVFRNSTGVVTGVEAGTPVPELVRAVCLSPGTGEFALDPTPSRVTFPAGGGRFANINNAAGIPDMELALDQLDSDLPECQSVSLVVSWFGDDLRCGHCRVEPRVEERDRTYAPLPWTVAGLSTATARLVSRSEGRPNFGGTPADGSIIRAIKELSARGKKVVLYPFLLMDIAEGNGLPDPYGAAEQPVFPWRGRITLDAAPGEPGSVDQTAAATAEVAAFFGTASASDFTITSGAPIYSGPNEWTWRRFVLHLAALAAAAGGVDAICIGTELRGLTTIRSAKADFPAVDQLIDLAAEVKAILPGAKITYAADWSEYFGHQPQDGTGDVLFHLDPLWADGNIDAVGIDDYTPLSDWRHSSAHLDQEAGSIYSLPYLQSQVEGGEHYDWFYASDADRLTQTRTPIADGAYDEPWVFRPKDIRNWWQNQHFNRIDGVREEQPTAWVPRSKPVWLTETGCPAVDLGANKPNLFFDERSSESGIPEGSRGARDDEMQRRFLQAKLGYWADNSNNPFSPIYGGRMIPADDVFVWTWDARPWPDFPVRESLWADGPSHRLGHWITGRVTAGSLAEVVAEICLASGMTQEEFDVSDLFGVVDGYVLDRVMSAREALQPLMQVFGFDAYESGGKIVFATRRDNGAVLLDPAWLVPGDGADRAPIVREKARLTATSDSIRLTYVQAENDYRVGVAEARLPSGDQLRVSETSVQLALPGSRAQAVADRWLSEAARAQESAGFAVPPSMIALEPGDLVQIDGTGGTEQYRVDRITETGAREVEALRVEPSLYIPTAAPERLVEPEAVLPPGPLDVIVMDLPLADGSDADHQPRIAVAADPWPGSVAVYKSTDGEGFTLAESVRKPSMIGVSNTILPPGSPGRWQCVAWDVILPAGGISSAERLAVLNGANLLAVELTDGEWEILQFQNAELIDTDTYRLSTLLRGQRGTDVISGTAISPGARIVVLDDALVPLPIDLNEISVTRHWKVGPAEFDLSHPSFISFTDSYDGTGLRPFAPAHLRMRRAAGDLAFTWVRTTRIGGDNLAAVEVPLAESGEAYRVTIRSGSTVLRTTDVDAPAYNYAALDQAADGASGTLTFGVARLSTQYGYGPERTIEFNV
ncbi:MAG: glycoside hydrolase TIM-barrel-like domain-containing protein [Pseudomonadota bacterium]